MCAHSECPACYVTLVDGVEETEETVKVLKQQVRSVIGPFATPEYIIVTAVRSVSPMGALLQCVHAIQSQQ